MEKAVEFDLGVLMAALFLRGAPRQIRVPKRQARPIEALFRRREGNLGTAVQLLDAEGYGAAAFALQEPGLLGWAERVVEERRCLTLADASYPPRWEKVLGDTAPPAVWRTGPIPRDPLFSITGSRLVPPHVESFANQCGRQIIAQGYSLVTGGASGCDRAASLGAMGQGGEVVFILPFGVNLFQSSADVSLLSACAPDEPFSTGNAMERNALIYASAEHSLVAHARFRVGGSWTGATEAMRRRLSRFLVRESPNEAGLRALRALGAIPVSSPEDLPDAIRRASPHHLFSHLPAVT